MIEPKPSSIGEAPSLADITSAGDRVGKVDFTSKLGDRMSEAQEADETAGTGRTRDGVVSLTSMVRPQRPTAAAEPDDDAPKMPFILPPAKVDAAMTAEAMRTRAEIAAARGELPEDDQDDADDLVEDDEVAHAADAADVVEAVEQVEPVEPVDVVDVVETVEPAPVPEGVEAPVVVPVLEVRPPAAPVAPVAPAVPVAPALARPVEPARAAEPAPPAPAAMSVRPADPEPEPRPVKRTGPPEGLVISDVADLDALAAQVAHREAEQAARADAEEQLRLEAETEAAALAAVEALARAAEIDAAELRALAEAEEPEEELPTPESVPLRTVNEVAATVIAAMRRINDAHERHVESLELETARRCELLTAQAELDAELIRLHARREAHAIISAARARTGEYDAEVVETDQLGEIGETFSRFAETIETTVATSPGSPDHLRKS